MSFDESDIYKIVAKKLDKSPDEIKAGLEKSLADFGADSLDRVEIIMDVEEKYQISVDEEDFGKKYGGNANTKNLVDYVREKVGVKK